MNVWSLTSNSLTEAIDLCMYISDFKVLIILDAIEDVIRYYKALKILLKEYVKHCDKYQFGASSFITLMNGSCIEITTSYDSDFCKIENRKYNRVLYNDFLDLDTALNKMLENTNESCRSDKLSEDMVDDSYELNEFLETFTINT